MGRQKTPAYTLLQSKRKNPSTQQALQGTMRTSATGFISASLFPGSTGVAGEMLTAREVGMGRGEEADNKKWSSMTRSVLLIASVLATMIKFIPFPAETEPPGKPGIGKASSPVLHLPYPEPRRIQQAAFRRQQSQPHHKRARYPERSASAPRIGLLLGQRSASARAADSAGQQDGADRKTSLQRLSLLLRTVTEQSAECQLGAEEALFNRFTKERRNKASCCYLLLS